MSLDSYHIEFIEIIKYPEILSFNRIYLNETITQLNAVKTNEISRVPSHVT